MLSEEEKKLVDQRQAFLNAFDNPEMREELLTDLLVDLAINNPSIRKDMTNDEQDEWHNLCAIAKILLNLANKMKGEGK